MSNQHLLSYLRREHARLEGELAREAARPLPDQVLLARLKKLKLAVKDQMGEAGRETRHVAA